jgi:hypothetical protein
LIRQLANRLQSVKVEAIFLLLPRQAENTVSLFPSEVFRFSVGEIPSHLASDVFAFVEPLDLLPNRVGAGLAEFVKRFRVIPMK